MLTVSNGGEDGLGVGYGWRYTVGYPDRTDRVGCGYRVGGLMEHLGAYLFVGMQLLALAILVGFYGMVPSWSEVLGAVLVLVGMGTIFSRGW